MQGAVAGAGAGVFHLMTANAAFSSIANPQMVPQRYFTIQRVNGNGGNGKGDGVAGPHKHTLEDSDRVKKNSVQRWMVKEDKEKKKTQVRSKHAFSLVILSIVRSMLMLPYWGRRRHVLRVEPHNACHSLSIITCPILLDAK